VNREQFEHFRHEAVHQLMALNEECEKAFKISSWPRWNYDLDEGTLTFSRNEKPGIIASIQVVGSTSKSGKTWLWAWANSNFPSNVKDPVAAVRAFGDAEAIPILTEGSSPDDEHIGWEMTAVAAKILGSKGAYRCPHESGIVYVVYSNIRFVDEGFEQTQRAKGIDCSAHGSGFSTYVCEHLITNPKQEWFSRDPDDSNRWPDAWCGACDAFFLEEGEWNDKNEKKVKIKILCHRCYELKRAQEEPS
jgi:hypothetical protein